VKSRVYGHSRYKVHKADVGAHGGAEGVRFDRQWNVVAGGTVRCGARPLSFMSGHGHRTASGSDQFTFWATSLALQYPLACCGSAPWRCWQTFLDVRKYDRWGVKIRPRALRLWVWICVAPGWRCGIRLHLWRFGRMAGRFLGGVGCGVPPVPGNPESAEWPRDTTAEA